MVTPVTLGLHSDAQQRLSCAGEPCPLGPQTANGPGENKNDEKPGCSIQEKPPQSPDQTASERASCTCQSHQYPLFFQTVLPLHFRPRCSGEQRGVGLRCVDGHSLMGSVPQPAPPPSLPQPSHGDRGSCQAGSGQRAGTRPTPTPVLESWLTLALGSSTAQEGNYRWPTQSHCAGMKDTKIPGISTEQD